MATDRKSQLRAPSDFAGKAAPLRTPLDFKFGFNNEEARKNYLGLVDAKMCSGESSSGKDNRAPVTSKCLPSKVESVTTTIAAQENVLNGNINTDSSVTTAYDGQLPDNPPKSVYNSFVTEELSCVKKAHMTVTNQQEVRPQSDGMSYKDMYNELKKQYVSTQEILGTCKWQLECVTAIAEDHKKFGCRIQSELLQRQEEWKDREKGLLDKLSESKINLNKVTILLEKSKQEYGSQITSTQKEKKELEIKMALLKKDLKNAGDSVVSAQAACSQLRDLCEAKDKEIHTLTESLTRCVAEHNEVTSRTVAESKANELLHAAQIEQVRCSKDAEIENLKHLLDLETSKALRLQSEVGTLKSSEIAAVKELSQKSSQLKSVEAQLLGAQLELEKCKSEQKVAARDNILKCESEIRRIGEAFKEKEAELAKKITCVEESLRNKEAELLKMEESYNQLRAYFGSSTLHDSLSSATWQEQKAQIVELQRTCDVLGNTNELLSIRLSSLSEILRIQEQEVARAPGYKAFAQQQPEKLLQRWREKVYSLLVCLKTQEITSKAEQRRFGKEVLALKDVAEEHRLKSELLSHQLAEKAAALQDFIYRLEAAQSQLLSKCQTEAALQNDLGRFEAALRIVYQTLRQSSNPVLGDESTLKKFLKVVNVTEARIRFANERIKVVQELISRRLEAEEKRNTVSREDYPQPGFNVNVELDHLRREINSLSRERTLLVQQLHSEKSKNKKALDESKSSYENELCSLQASLEGLESQLQEVRLRSGDLEEKCEKLARECSQKTKEIERLNAALAREKDVAERDFDVRLREETSTFEAKIRKYEETISEIRREHTKTIVLLRQAERQLDKDKEKHSNFLALTEKEHQLVVSKLNKELIRLGKDNNLLMTTIRQEGLKLPGKRLRPRTGYSSDTETQKKDVSNSVKLTVADNKEAITQQLGSDPFVRDSCTADVMQTENLTTLNTVTELLEDIQALSGALMDENCE